MDRRFDFFHPRLLIGAFVLVAGVLIALDALGVVDAAGFLRFWPVAIVLIGLGRLLNPDRPGGKLWGVLLVLFGSYLLAASVFSVPLDGRILLSAGLVLLGFSLIRRALFPGAGNWPAHSGAEMSVFALLGGVERKNNSAAFRGGDAAAVMGGVTIDLTEASAAEGGAVLDTFALWGGVEIRVPRDWQVVVEGVPILGGFEDRTARPPEGSQKRLLVRGLALMGGVEVKN